MVFTPLLPQTTTGTLEFRSVCKSVVGMRPDLKENPNSVLIANVHDVDTEKKEAAFPIKSLFNIYFLICYF